MITSFCHPPVETHDGCKGTECGRRERREEMTADTIPPQRVRVTGSAEVNMLQFTSYSAKAAAGAQGVAAEAEPFEAEG